MIALLLLAQVVEVENTDAWKTDRGDVRAVLSAAARELWVPAKGPPDVRIRVSPKGGPIALYRRGDDGAFLVKLNVEDSYWAQYVFQFAHEVAHVLCGVREKTHKHAWLEESMCEVASLFALRRAAESWKTSPPFPALASFAPKLADYAAKRLAEVPPPKDATLAAWVAANREALEKTPEDRPRNRVVAAALLPLFEAEPSAWEALRTWPSEGGPDASLADVLAAWRRAAPERHHAFLDRLAETLGARAR